MAGMWWCPVPGVRVERGCEDAHEHRAFPVEDLPAQGKALYLHRTPGQRYPLARDAPNLVNRLGANRHLLHP